LSLRLLIDEDSQAKHLVNLLRKAGHDAIAVNEAELSGSEDPLVLDYAISENRVLLTSNCDDFQTLHQANSNHPGILAIYKNDDPFKDMSRQEIVKAIAFFRSLPNSFGKPIYLAQSLELSIGEIAAI
jgi:predicted nuclease of predicted toxin-antitoxin system